MRRQCFLNSFHRQEHFQLVTRQRNKAELLVVSLRVLIFCIDEKTYPASRVENLHELCHRGHQQLCPYALALGRLRDRQAPQPDTCNITRQLLCLLWCKLFRFHLTNIKREKA